MRAEFWKTFRPVMCIIRPYAGMKTGMQPEQTENGPQAYVIFLLPDF